MTTAPEHIKRAYQEGQKMALSCPCCGIVVAMVVREADSADWPDLAQALGILRRLRGAGRLELVPLEQSIEETVQGQQMGLDQLQKIVRGGR